MAEAPRIRPAVEEDLAQLAELFDAYRQFYLQPANRELAARFMQERLRRRDSTILVATVREPALLGFTQLYPTLCSVSAAPIYILYDLFVSESARCGGLGRALMEAARHRAQLNGAVRMELATAISNTSAQRLYESLGWVRDNEFYRYSMRLG